MEISCSMIRNQILKDVKEEIERLNITPSLVIVTCSNDEASKIYVRNKIKTANEVGIKVKHYNLDPARTTQEGLQELVHNLNYHYNSVMVQLPLDKKFDESKVLNCIDPSRDCDGLTEKQRVMLEDNHSDALVPPTAMAAFEIMNEVYRTDDFSGREVLIINRSKLVGIPLDKLLRNHNATVTVAHSKTRTDINDLLRDNEYDVVVTATGSHIIEEERMCNTLIIDCGIAGKENGKIIRDVIRSGEKSNVYAGAVGVITVACLMRNVLECCKQQNR